MGFIFQDIAGYFLSVVVESLSLYQLYNQMQTKSHKSGMCQ